MAKTTKVYLLNVPIERDYKHTLYFSSKDEQYNYFFSKRIKSYTDFSYQRKDNVIRVPAHFEDILTCNYVIYQNPDYNNKWFYAFITNIEYSQPDRTNVYIETDCIQTWMFDVNVLQCFVEREHTKDDTPGVNTLPECVETGDFICSAKHKYSPLTETAYVVGSTVDLRNDSVVGFGGNYAGHTYQGVISAAGYYYYSSVGDLQSMIDKLDKAGKGDAIVGVFMVPKQFISLDSSGVSENLVLGGLVGPVTKKWSDSEPLVKVSTINGYTPKNKKLLTYPYTYILMSNNAGASAVYKYELFNSENCDFNINFALTPGCSIRLIPLNYNGTGENNEEGLSGAKFPIGSWTNDVYINWLTQNSLNHETQIINTIVSAAPGAVANGVSGVTSGVAAGAAGGPWGAVAGGAAGGVGSIYTSGIGLAANLYTTISSINAEKYAHSLQPPQASGNLNSGDVTCSNGDLTFTAYKMSIKAEFARVIDDYFSMFGYQTNRVKVPNKNHRKNYWFTKTADANIIGNIPQNDLQIIKNVYNNGITFWRTSATLGDYSNNPII